MKIPDLANRSLMSEISSWCCYCCCCVELLSLRSSVSLLHTLLFKCTFVVRCGVYTLLTTHQSGKPHRSSFLLAALSPTLPKNTHNPHPNFPSAPGAHLTAEKQSWFSPSGTSGCTPPTPTPRHRCQRQAYLYVLKQLMAVHLLSDRLLFSWRVALLRTAQ